MTRKCLNCNLVNFADAESCGRCGNGLPLVEQQAKSKDSRLYIVFRRLAIFVLVCVISIGVFYSSLVFTAAPLSAQETMQVESAIDTLDQKGFVYEAYLLRNLAVLRSNDNWLNASVPKENAFAATNYPFEIITLYPDFFSYPTDSTERAAILLHEALHLNGHDEKAAYEFVWKNRKYLGWTNEKYGNSVVWQNVRRQTREYSPHLFVCDFNPYHDCTN